MLFAVSLRKRTRFNASVACLICSMEYRLILETISTFAVSKTVSYLLLRISGLLFDLLIYHSLNVLKNQWRLATKQSIYYGLWTWMTQDQF